MAIKALAHHLARIPNAADRRIAAARATAHYCTEASVHETARILDVTQQVYSQEGHGADSLRQNSIFSEESAALAGCQIDPEREGFGKCKP
jgi:hypothetical protein